MNSLAIVEAKAGENVSEISFSCPAERQDGDEFKSCEIDQDWREFFFTCLN